MEQENQQLLVDFWMAATNFRSQMQESEKSTSNEFDAVTAQTDAMVLYDKFFSLQASHNLGFSDKFRFHIESNICSEKGPEFHCFDDAIRIVLYVLETKYLAKYLQSQLYEGYIKDLVSSIRGSR